MGFDTCAVSETSLCAHVEACMSKPDSLYPTTYMQLVQVDAEGRTAEVGPDLFMLGAHANTRVQLLLLQHTVRHSTAQHNTRGLWVKTV